MTYLIVDKNGRNKSFGTAKKLLDELSDRNNGWLEGQGSRIEKKDELLFHTDDYVRFVTDPHLECKTPSIKAIISHVKERDEMMVNYAKQSWGE